MALETMYSSPCWLATNMTSVSPSPIVTTGISRPVLEVSGAGLRSKLPFARPSIDSRVLQSCS